MYICIYIYICCGVINWASLGVFKVINWAKSKLLAGPRSFSHYKNRVSGDFFSVIIVCVFFWCPIIWQLSKNSLFQKKGAILLLLFFFFVLSLNLENSFFRFAKTL